MASCGDVGGPDVCPDLDQSHGVLRDFLPRGRAWAAARRPGTVTWHFWRAIARLYQFANDRICAATEEAFCSTIAETRDLWLIEYGLPDACDPFPDLCAKVGAIGSARCEYYTEVAAAAGWSIACADLPDDCGARAGCAQAGCATPGSSTAGGTLVISVDIGESPAYMGATWPLPQAGILQAGQNLACRPQVDNLICVLDRVMQAHLQVVYEITMDAPADLTARVSSGYDLEIFWSATAGAAYRLEIMTPAGEVVDTLSVTATSTVAIVAYTAARQIAFLGAAGGELRVTVRRVLDGYDGAEAPLDIDISTLLSSYRLTTEDGTAIVTEDGTAIMTGPLPNFGS